MQKSLPNYPLLTIAIRQKSIVKSIKNLRHDQAFDHSDKHTGRESENSDIRSVTGSETNLSAGLE